MKASLTDNISPSLANFLTHNEFFQFYSCLKMSIPENQQRNYEIFRDCLAAALIEKISEPASKPRRRTKTKSSKKRGSLSQSNTKEPTSTPEFNENGNVNGEARENSIQRPSESKLETKLDHEQETPGIIQADETASNTDDLAEFTDYTATATFAALPEELKEIDHYDFIASPTLTSRYTPPFTGADIATHFPVLDPSITDSLSAYTITNESTQGINEFLAPIFTSFIEALLAPPPPPKTTRADVDACEICGRDWVRLTYHHLIPRFVHAKAVKRGWHRECDLQNVAWLCSSCHGFVHRFAVHEDLARYFYTVDLLLAEEEVQNWAKYAYKLRFKGR
ncbi:YisB protein [Xylariaceae sp. FL0255]|nr:YisB protein [Xylariaceae sp. FL0255]